MFIPGVGTACRGHSEADGHWAETKRGTLLGGWRGTSSLYAGFMK